MYVGAQARPMLDAITSTRDMQYTFFLPILKYKLEKKYIVHFYLYQIKY